MDEFQLPTIQSNVLILQDAAGNPREFIFHVENGDYFAMLATLLGFVEEAANKLEAEDEAMKIAASEIARLRENLIFLQANYKIEPKEKSQ
ncbi:MAG: hypothetical protein V4437_01590 [Patescibacteria group bacterium]